MPSFELIGPVPPVSPLILSVPHAGRDYPMALRAALRVSVEQLVALEDRHVDALARAARVDETLLVQSHARAWIDLNRGEHERDPEIDEGAGPLRRGPSTHKVRSGLGLVPRRGSGAGMIWGRRLGADEVAARIASDHRPYHAALAGLLAAARERFGCAILLDLHSMPSLAGRGAPQLVIGDRFGRSAAGRFVARIEAEARHHGVAAGLNTPYAGGHMLDRHGAPLRGVHAIQLEFDRALYLDERLDAPGPGLERSARLLRAILDALADEAAGALPIAAE